MDRRRTFLAAAASFVELVERVPDGRWDAPGLGVWNLRELTGHTVGALVVRARCWASIRLLS
jgi:hypothetical protein